MRTAPSFFSFDLFSLSSTFHFYFIIHRLDFSRDGFTGSSFDANYRTEHALEPFSAILLAIYGQASILTCGNLLSGLILFSSSVSHQTAVTHSSIHFTGIGQWAKEYSGSIYPDIG